jgi:V8-like Glu-specific endopeptidase
MVFFTKRKLTSRTNVRLGKNLILFTIWSIVIFASASTAHARNGEINFKSGRIDLTRLCYKNPGPVGGAPQSAYRYILSVKYKHMSDNWRVGIKAANDPSLDELLLSAEIVRNALPGLAERELPRFLTPKLNTSNRDYCISTLVGNVPTIKIVSQIVTTGNDRPLSLKGKSPNTEYGNFILASNLWAKPNEPHYSIHGEFTYTEEKSGNGDPPGTQHQLWTDEHMARAPTAEDNRETVLSPAFLSMVWLGTENFRAEEKNINPKEGYVAGCTGFFIAPRVLATARHCVKSAESGVNVVHLRGWLRKPEGEASRNKAPELQQLEVAVIGDYRQSDNAYDDYALLLVKERTFKAPAFVRLAVWSKQEDKLLTAMGFPVNPTFGQFPLVLSYDNFCRWVRVEEDDRVLQHGCDTYHGSSGGPILDRDLSEVGALHFAGWKTGKLGCDTVSDETWANCWNRSLPVSEIIRSLAEKRSALTAIVAEKRTFHQQTAIDVIDMVYAAQPHLDFGAPNTSSDAALDEATSVQP